MISIILTSYNSEGFIARTLQSVLAQTYKDIEVIIVNDCSMDNTEQVIKNIASRDSRIRYYRNEINVGAGLSRRRAISEMRGEYMTFLDHDDLLKPDAIETMVNTIQSNDVDVIVQGFIMVDEEGNVLEERIPKKSIFEGFDKFKKKEVDVMRFMNPMLIKSSLWNKVQYSHRRFIEDTQTLVQILWYVNKVMTIPYAGYYYVQKDTSLCHTAKRIKYEIAKALCIKDIMFFFRDKVAEFANPKDFLNQCEKVFSVLTEADFIEYKEDLEELAECIKSL
jgi:glycosyltransferase involved in cell wall biosynthesis